MKDPVESNKVLSMFRGSLDNSPTKAGGVSESMVSQSIHSKQPPINKEHIIPPDEVEPKIATNATIFEKTIVNDGKKDPPILGNSALKRRKLASQTG